MYSIAGATFGGKDKDYYREVAYDSNPVLLCVSQDNRHVVWGDMISHVTVTPSTLRVYGDTTWEVLSYVSFYHIAVLLLGKVDFIVNTQLTGDLKYYITLRRIPPGHIFTEDEVAHLVNSFFYATPRPGFND